MLINHVVASSFTNHETLRQCRWRTCRTAPIPVQGSREHRLLLDWQHRWWSFRWTGEFPLRQMPDTAAASTGTGGKCRKIYGQCIHCGKAGARNGSDASGTRDTVETVRVTLRCVIGVFAEKRTGSLCVCTVGVLIRIHLLVLRWRSCFGWWR